MGIVFSVDQASCNIDNLSINLKYFIQVETLDNHHHDIPVSIITCGDGYPDTSYCIVSFSENLDL